MGAKRGKRRKGDRELVEEIVGRLVRQRSTADVLFHHALAVRLGLGPADHKCLDLLRERGAMSGSELVAITGLTSGAITGVAARLEQAGYLRREPDAHDGRKQILYPVTERLREVHEDVFVPLRDDVAGVLERFDTHQLAAIAEFLSLTTDVLYRHLGLLRGQTLRGQTLNPAGHAARDMTRWTASERPSARKRKRRGRRERR
jgi:DNA-binding MarR family transcriptional regulator